MVIRSSLQLETRPVFKNAKAVVAGAITDDLSGRDHPSTISDAMHEDEGGNNNVCSNDDGDGSSDGDDNDEDERRVKEIVGKRFNPRKRRIEYHVLWHGSAGEMTSEPIEHLENCKKMLKEYHDSERGKNSSRGRPNKRAKK
ncbi:MAG: hypothetical protein Q9185_002668 [Variospora sp. 1 TL-2023]